MNKKINVVERLRELIASGELQPGQKLKNGIDLANDFGVAHLTMRRALRELELSGIEIAEDVKRYYPSGAFLAHTLGSVTDDNTGLSGIELEYNQYLSGVEGRWIKDTDISGNTLTISRVAPQRR